MDHSDHDHHEGTGHVEPLRTYLIAAGALLVLTIVTVAVAFVDLGPFSDIVALGIAASKAAIIVFIFMHARYTTGITRLVMVVGVIWLAILIVGVMDDYLTRDWLLIPGK